MPSKIPDELCPQSLHWVQPRMQLLLCQLFEPLYRPGKESWGSYVDVKVNAAERLRAQLRRSRQGTVLISSVTDPYQPIEAEFGITRSCLLLLTCAHLHVSILTKSDLVCRDVDVLKDLPAIEVGLTITPPSDALSQLLEEGAPPTSTRLGALAAFGGGWPGTVGFCGAPWSGILTLLKPRPYSKCSLMLGRAAS